MDIAVTLPHFTLSCYMSTTNPYGARFTSTSLQLAASLRLAAAHALKRSATIDSMAKSAANKSAASRPPVVWKVNHINAELINTQIHLFGKAIQLVDRKKITTGAASPSTRPAPNNNNSNSTKNGMFFMSLTRVSYRRNAADQSSTMATNSTTSLDAPIHQLIVDNLRIAFTVHNRETVLAIFDGLTKNRLLRRNISTAALKEVQFVENPAQKADAKEKTTTAANSIQHRQMPSMSSSSDVGYSSLLQQLLDEKDAKFIAYHEESAHRIASEQLNGIALVQQADDVTSIQWHIELRNSQMALFGGVNQQQEAKSPIGHVLCTAARAILIQRQHRPVFRNATLLGKASWNAQLTGMQYFAPAQLSAEAEDVVVDAGATAPTIATDQSAIYGLHWLSREYICEVGSGTTLLDEQQQETQADLETALDEQKVTEAADLTQIDGDDQQQRTSSECKSRAKSHRRHRSDAANAKVSVVDAFMANSDAVGGLLTNQNESERASFRLDSAQNPITI